MALSVFSIEALKVFTTPAYFGATKVIPIISFTTLFLSMQIFTPGLQIAKKTKTMATINIIAAVVNTILCFVFIPFFGIIGAALATLTSATLILITNMYFSQKLFYIPHQWKRIIPAFIFPAVFVLFIFSLGNFSGLGLFAKNIIKAALWLVSAFIIVKILIRKDELKEIIRQSKEILRVKLNSIF
jgi:O-antigen/teichoic acid export membrane protein